MNASKEETRKAQAEVSIALEHFSKTGDEMGKEAMSRVLDFLSAAERKLPTEAAYVKDKKRVGAK